MRIAARVDPIVYTAAAALAHATFITGLSAQTIRVGENVRVARGLENRPLVEPHLAAHPTNPNHLLGATIVGDSARAWGETQTCSSFLSLDAGKTWRRHDFPITRCGDPWVAITPQGHAVFVALGVHRALPRQQGPGSLVAFHSSDGGRTWDDQPVGFGLYHDRPTVAVDTGSAPARRWLYVISRQGIRDKDGMGRGSVFVTRSRNGGAAFEDPVRIVPSNLELNAELPAVLSDGTLIVSFADFGRDVYDHDEEDGSLEAPRTWVLRSTDAGRTFSVPLFADETCGRDWSALAADNSVGPFHDRLYHACMRRPGGAIVLNYSTDRGETWTASRRVHSAPADTMTLRTSSMLAVNKNGVVGVAWIDSRTRPGKRCHEVYFTASFDGGRTFLPEQRVSSGRSCPGHARNGAAFARWPTGGDYHGMVATSDGRFHLFWSDARNAIFQLWTTTVDVSGREAEVRR